MQNVLLRLFSLFQKEWRMTDTPSPRPSPLGPFAGGALAALGSASSAPAAGRASYADIRPRRLFASAAATIVRAPTAPGRGYDGPDHQRMQMAH